MRPTLRTSETVPHHGQDVFAPRRFTFVHPSPGAYDRTYIAVFKEFYRSHLALSISHAGPSHQRQRLSVHEHPQRIGKPVNRADLMPGMVSTKMLGDAKTHSQPTYHPDLANASPLI